jgi:hypothetical protein
MYAGSAFTRLCEISGPAARRAVSFPSKCFLEKSYRTARHTPHPPGLSMHIHAGLSNTATLYRAYTSCCYQTCTSACTRQPHIGLTGLKHKTCIPSKSVFSNISSTLSSNTHTSHTMVVHRNYCTYYLSSHTF